MANTVFRVHERILHRVLLVIGFLTFVVCYIYNFPSSLYILFIFKYHLLCRDVFCLIVIFSLLVVSFSGFFVCNYGLDMN